MIGVLSDYFASNKYHNEYYRRSPMTIPGMWITRAEATRVRRLLDRDPTAQALHARVMGWALTPKALELLALHDAADVL